MHQPSVQGTYQLCGSNFVLDFTCSGPHCGLLSDYPDVNCATANGVLTCTSAVSCDELVVYSSEFKYTQPDISVITSETALIPIICEKLEITSDFTKAGTSFKEVEVLDCVPQVPRPPASSSAPSSSVPTSSVLSSSVLSSSLPSSSAQSSSVGTSSSEPSSIKYSATTPSSGSASTKVYQTQPSPSSHSPLYGTYTGSPPTYTSTVLSTRTYTVTSCERTVTDCPVGYVTTDVVTSYSTYCPDVNVHSVPDSNPDAYPDVPGATSGYETKGWKAAGAESIDAVIASSSSILPTNGPSSYASAATQEAVYTAGARQSRASTMSLLWCGLLIFGFLIQGIAAASVHPVSSPRDIVPNLDSREADTALVPRMATTNRNIPHSKRTSSPYEADRALALHDRQVLGDAIALAKKLIAHFKAHVPESDLADILVESLFEIGCDIIESKAALALTDILLSKAFAVEFTAACRVAVTDLVIIGAPEITLVPGGVILLNMGSGMLCNFMIGSVFHIPDLVNGICKYPKPCTKDFTSDPDNCGRCGNVVSIYLPRLSPHHIGRHADKKPVLNKSMQKLSLHKPDLHRRNLLHIHDMRRRRNLCLRQYQRRHGLLRRRRHTLFKSA